MKKLLKPTAFAVLFFIVLFSWFSMESAEASEHAVTLGMAGGVLNTSGYVTQRIGYEYAEKWFVRYERLGGKSSTATTANSYTVGRRVSKNWKKVTPYMGLGVTYIDEEINQIDKGKPLITDNLMFNLELGILYSLSSDSDISLGFTHNSTAGRTDRNRGVDRIHLTYTWKIP